MTVCSIASVGAVPLQVYEALAGEPLLKMFNPWLPLRRNLTGIALPALTVLTVGRLSTGGKKPAQP